MNKDYYTYGMQMPGRNGSASEYEYGFNGMLKDDELKGKNNSYDFGARMYDPRVGRFLNLDPKAFHYPNFSPYCYADNSPILFIDENGEGPILGFIKFAFFGRMQLAKITGYTVSETIKVRVGAGMGPALAAGATAHITMAADPKGNIAIVMGTKVFYDVMSSETGVGHNSAAEEGNTALGGFAGLGVGMNFHNKESVLDFAGNSSGNAGVSISIGKGLSGSVEVGEDNAGIALGIGIGAGFAMIGSENTVLASNYKDIAKFEDAGENAQSLADEKGGKTTLNYNISVKGKVVTLDYTFTVTKEKNGKIEVLGTYSAGKVNIDTENGSIYTETVKK